MGWWLGVVLWCGAELLRVSASAAAAASAAGNNLSQAPEHECVNLAPSAASLPL